MTDPFGLIHQYGLSEMHFRADPPSGLQAIIAIHNTYNGPALGGCRFIEYPRAEDAIRDAARLAQGMACKAALAGLPLGGGKSVVIKPSGDFDREKLFAQFGRFVEDLGGRYITALDSGTSLQDMDIIARHTSYVSSGTRFGDCSESTAAGVFQSLQTICRKVLGPKLGPKTTFAIQGLGHVGMLLAKLLRRADARLVVCDPDPALVSEARRELGAQVVSPDDIYHQDCDIFVPCALGGIVNDATVPQFRCSVIAGAANNQLADDRHAKVLHERGIIFIPDFVINAGGLIHASLRYFGHSENEIFERIREIPLRVSTLIDTAAENHISPWEYSLGLTQQKLGEAATITPLPHQDSTPLSPPSNRSVVNR
ncbi:MAG TPA: amino acid dehydrogenase [Porticoccaceae bacterium]|nr:amino acid dehydrogenase [Porticoccaceae bacterium]